MTFWKLLWRSLVFYRKSFFWIIAGAALSTTIFVGALVVGDSVKFSLREMVFHRLGKTQLVITSGDRFFREDLAGELSSDLNVQTAPLLYARGTASSDGGLRRAHRIQVVGVDSRFVPILSEAPRPERMKLSLIYPWPGGWDWKPAEKLCSGWRIWTPCRGRRPWPWTANPP